MWNSSGYTYDSTLENSLDGDMTKLSFVLLHEIKCWMLWSSSILYSLCMKAVCTTLGCCAAAAAPTAGAEEPLGEVFPESPFARSFAVVRSVLGGPIDEVEVGVMSIGSRGGASVEPDEGRMGIDLCKLGLCGSGEKGLRRSATEAIMARGCDVRQPRC